MFFGEERRWCVRLTFYRPLRADFLYNMGFLTFRTLQASTVYYVDSFTFLCVDDNRTSQETHVCASRACYGGSFTFIYVDYVRTSQETHL
jgi:hypothetical protein